MKKESNKPIYKEADFDWNPQLFEKIVKNNTRIAAFGEFKLYYKEGEDLFKSRVLGEYCYDKELIENVDNYIMLLQINFDDIVSSNSLMPKNGILQIFVSKNENIKDAKLKAIYNLESENNMSEYSLGNENYYDYITCPYVIDFWEVKQAINSKDPRFDAIMKNLDKEMLILNENEFKMYYDSFTYGSPYNVYANMLCYGNSEGLIVLEDEEILFCLETVYPSVKVLEDAKIYITIKQEALANKDFSNLKLQYCRQ